MLALGAVACGGARPPAAAPETPLALSPLAGLAAAAGLEWLLALEPRALADALPAVETLIPPARFSLFAARHGGIDPRRADEIVVASYPHGALVLVRAAIDPAAVEKAFVERAVRVEARAADHPDVVRVSAEVGTAREHLVVFGRRGVALAVGAPEPSRAAQLFAEGRLKRASPALRSPPLDLAAEVLGPAPARLFFPGPFAGEAASGFGGLLKAASAAAVGVRARGDVLAARIALVEAEGKDRAAAQQRLGATWDAVAESGLGKLCGLDKPRKAPWTPPDERAVVLEVELDAMAVARGLRDATEAPVADIFKL